MSKVNPIVKLFEKSGEDGSVFLFLEILKDEFIKMNWDEFYTIFINALMSVIISDATINCESANNMIKFAANGVSVLSEHTTIDGRSGLYLISEVFQLYRKYGSADKKSIRWRFCLFMNHLLSFMSAGALLSVELCEIATILLLERLQDKKPEIRTQAAHALHWLQIPDNPQCKIVEKFMFHMNCDPSIEVRTAIVKEIAMLNNVVNEMLKSTIFDISDNVRKEAYNRFSTYPFLSLSVKQRQTILEKGLEDKNENIKLLVKKRLLEHWLEECENNFEVFLKNLEVENEILCEKILNITFEKYYDCQILDLANKFLNRNSRTIDFDQLTVEKIFLWKYIAKYLTTEKKIALSHNQGQFNDYYNMLLPDVVKYSDYVREYFFFYDSKDDKEFILIQLLNMARTLVIDDVGAASLNKLCSDLILDNRTSVKLIQLIVVLLNLNFKNGQDILIYVKQILNEIQVQIIDLYPKIDKVGKKEVLEHQIDSKTKSIEELLKNESKNAKTINISIILLKEIKKEYDEINVLTEEKVLVDAAVKNLLKGFELVFQVQQFPNVGSELSLLTDIVQNVIVGYLECSMVNIRMEAIRCLSPYILVSNVTAAKKHMNILYDEILNPLTNKHMLCTIMFDLFLHYDLKTFDMKDNFDMDEEYENVSSVSHILPLLASYIDYEVNDSSFKSVVIKGFCDLLIFKKVKSINLISKFLIIWLRPLSREKSNIYNNLIQFFTSYMFHIRSSSSTLAKCYVPILRDINKNDLVTKLDIKMDEVNSILINLSRGVLFKNEKMAVNAHGELASNILDYLYEDQPYTDMLADILCKLEINFDSDNEFMNILCVKLLRLVEHLKKLGDKNSVKYLKKIKHKFVPVLQNKAFGEKAIEKKVDITEMEKKSEEEVITGSTQESEPITKMYCDFSHKNIYVDQRADDENDVEVFPKLDAMKRMSEVLKKSFNAKTLNN